jgi:hypothetical protein
MTKLFKQRLELLAELGTVETSKNGNYFVVLKENKQEITKEFTARCATKNTLHKLNSSFNYSKTFKEIVMLGSDNSILYKPADKEIFSKVSSRTVMMVPKLQKLYLYNKRCEFLRNYPTEFMKFYSLLKSFKSMKEVFAYLGVTAKVEFSVDLLEKCITGYQFKNKTVIIEANLLELNDTIRMAAQLGRDITQTDKSIKNLHTELIELISLQEADSYSDSSITPSYFNEIKEKLKDYNPTFYTSHKQLFLAGKKFVNCISSRSYKLDTHVFFSVDIDDVEIVFEIDRNNIIEAKAKYNRTFYDKQNIIAAVLNFKKSDNKDLPF